jgi:predicted AlkP superfamily pyrophosphatase or phosphodiesterase
VEVSLKRKVLLIIIDGQPWRAARRLNGNLEGWVQSGQARVWKMRSVIPSTSASCYASIHTGVTPQVHGVVSNEALFRVTQSDIFSQVKAAGGTTGAVAHSFWSIFFNRAPWDFIRDIEYDDPDGSISHGRFHTMTGYGSNNQMTPSDADLFATLSMLTERHGIDYGIYHSCTLDSMGHRFGHDCVEMDHACAMMDGMLAHFLPRWLEAGYEVAVTADHGQTDRGHHGGREDDQQDVAFYWFGGGKGPEPDVVLDQLSLAPTLLSRMGAPIADTMKAKPFLMAD